MRRLRHLPRWVAIAGWLTCFAGLLAFELLAVATVTPGDTISEVVWWLIGIGQGVTWYFLLARIAVFGALGWLFLHFETRRV